MFVYTYTLVDDLTLSRTGSYLAASAPDPGHTDTETITIVPVRLLLHRPNESRLRTETRRDQPDLFPHLAHPSEFNQRAHWR